MKRLTGAAIALLFTAACSGQPSDHSTAPASVASVPTLAQPSDVETGPVSIKPTAGTFKYLQRRNDGVYGCKDGMTLVVLNLTKDIKSDESGKHTTTTYNGVTFETLLSDGYYWLSYPAMPMELRAVVIDEKSGFEMPTYAWYNNPVAVSGSDASLHLRDLPNQKLSSLWICLATPTR